MTHKTSPGLASSMKDKLIQQALERRMRQTSNVAASPSLEGMKGAARTVPEQFYRFDQHPGYQQLRIMLDGAARFGLTNPFFKLHEGLAGAETVISGNSYVNFASYNY